MRENRSWWAAWSCSRPARRSCRGWWSGRRTRRRGSASPPSLHHGHRRGVRDRRALAELAVSVVTPTIRPAVGLYAADVVPPGLHGGEAKPTGDSHRTAPRGGRPVTELTVAVLAPAVRGAMSGHTARMDVAGAHPGEAAHAHDDSRVRPVRGVVGARSTVAQLTATVVAPADRHAPSDHAARVSMPGADRGEAEPARYEHWRRPSVRGAV